MLTVKLVASWPFARAWLGSKFIKPARAASFPWRLSNCVVHNCWSRDFGSGCLVQVNLGQKTWTASATNVCSIRLSATKTTSRHVAPSIALRAFSESLPESNFLFVGVWFGAWRVAGCSHSSMKICLVICRPNFFVASREPEAPADQSFAIYKRTKAANCFP